MKAIEILELVRAGYTRAEIDEMDVSPTHDDSNHETADDDTNHETPHDDSNHETKHDDTNHELEPIPKWAQALNTTLDELRKTIQASNIRGDDMGDEDDVVDAAEIALAQYITGKAPESKAKGGNKRK